MYNWSTDTNSFTTPEGKERFVLEQRINFGLRGSKLSVPQLLKFWNQLEIDPARRAFLSLLLYGTSNPHQMELLIKI